MSQMSDRARSRVAAVAYLTGGTMLLFVLTDVAAFAWPFVPGQAMWRYGLVGLISGALYNPILAMVLLYAASLLSNHPGVTRAVGVLAALGAAGLIAALGIFGFDFETVRALTPQEQSGRFVRAAFQAALKLALGTAVLLYISISSFRHAAGARRTKRNGQEGPGLVSSPAKAKT